MLSDDELRAAAETALRLGLECARGRSREASLANLGIGASAAGTPKLPAVPQDMTFNFTRAEIAEYLDLAGHDPDKACELATAERALEFGDSLSSKHLQVFAHIIDNAPEQVRATLQLQTVDLLSRWLLRKREVVGPDGRIVVGVRIWAEAKKIVAAWLSDEFASHKDSKIEKTEILGPVDIHEGEAPRTSSPERTGITPLSKARLGRPTRFAADFVDFAGLLWRNTQRPNPESRSNTSPRFKVTDDQLCAIAASLDSKGYIPPAKYLEGAAANHLKSYNSRNSNSKAGAIKTWSQLVSVADKDHLRGMRRLLSRCAKKVSSELHHRVRK